MVAELKRFPLLRRGGAFSVNKKSPQASMEALKYSVRVLKDLNNILYIYPQGIIKPPNFRPIEFQSGVSYIAEKAAKAYGKVNLIPIAVDYVFLRDNRPEVWVEFGEHIELTESKVKMEEAESRFSKLAFNPIGTVKAVAENFGTGDYSQDEIDLFKALTNQ